MARASRREAERIGKPPKAGRYTLGVFAVLASEFVLRDILLPPNASALQIGAVLVAEWMVLIVLLALWISRAEGLPRVGIGWTKPKWRHLWLGLLAYLLVTGAMMVSGFILPAVGLEPIRSLQPKLVVLGWPVLVGLFVTGTILEEIVYRGFLIERVALLTGRVWLAGLVSWLAFTLVHLRFFGMGPTIDVSIFSAALVILYLKERSLWPCIVLHGLNDLLAFVVFPLLMR